MQSQGGGQKVVATAELVYMELFLIDDNGNKLTMENGRIRIVFECPEGTNKNNYDYSRSFKRKR